MRFFGNRPRREMVSALFSRALKEWERGALRTTLSLLEEIEEQFPLEEIPAVFLLRAQVFSELGSLEDAEREAEKVLRMDPTSFQARMVLGRVLMERGSHLEALEHLQIGAVLYPWAEEIRSLLSQMRKRMKEGSLSGVSEEVVHEVRESTGKGPDETPEG